MATQTLKTNKELLTGKVSSILTERELAINIGSNHGVALGMRFKVLAEQPTEIRDPETDDVLGIVEREKIRIEVSEVQERFSICRTTTASSDHAFAAAIAFADVVLPAQRIPQMPDVDNPSFLFSKEDSYVKKGDRVVQIITAEN